MSPPMAMEHPPGARTPEELSMLLEDALIVGDAVGIEQLFETGAVLLGHKRSPQAHGPAAIAAEIARAQSRGRSVALPDRVLLQSRDLALTLGTDVHVLRRGPDWTWRYALSVLDLGGRS